MHTWFCAALIQCQDTVADHRDSCGKTPRANQHRESSSDVTEHFIIHKIKISHQHIQIPMAWGAHIQYVYSCKNDAICKLSLQSDTTAVKMRP